MAHLLLVGPRPIAITVWLVRDHSLLYATAPDDTGTCFIHFFLWDAWVRYQNYNNHICDVVVSHCIPEVIIFRCLMRLSETPPPKKKKGCESPWWLPGGGGNVCLFFSLWKSFPHLFPFSRFSAFPPPRAHRNPGGSWLSHLTTNSTRLK